MYISELEDEIEAKQYSNLKTKASLKNQLSELSIRNKRKPTFGHSISLKLDNIKNKRKTLKTAFKETMRLLSDLLYSKKKEHTLNR